jgi:hypothetical protein
MEWMEWRPANSGICELNVGLINSAIFEWNMEQLNMLPQKINIIAGNVS